MVVKLDYHHLLVIQPEPNTGQWSLSEETVTHNYVPKAYALPFLCPTALVHVHMSPKPACDQDAGGSINPAAEGRGTAVSPSRTRPLGPGASALAFLNDSIRHRKQPTTLEVFF